MHRQRLRIPEASRQTRRPSRLALTCLGWMPFLPLQPLLAEGQTIRELMRATEAVRRMDEAELTALVPVQSGLHFVGCPNCDSGRQEQQLTWHISRPDEVVCRYCNHRYPSSKYPMNDAIEVAGPAGQPASFEYWTDQSGYRYFFAAKRDDEVRKYLARQTLNLAKLYEATSDEEHARRAAVLLDRFAQVFPGWCYHYDYPFRQKEIYDGDVSPAEFRSGFRTARWNWWAYHDIPIDLVEAFGLVRGSGVFERLSREQGVDVADRIVEDLLRNAGEQVFANHDRCSNMSPSVWRSLIRLGRTIEEPRYVHEVMRRLQRLRDQKFFYDGFWCEGAPSYARQTLASLQRVVNELEGYSDPPGYIDQHDGKRFENLDAAEQLPLLEQASAALEKMALPDGRFVPVHDTWAMQQRLPPFSLRDPFLLPGLGHACLGQGEGADRTECHLSWSGGYGHQHADLLNLILFARGQELLSDLGYSHTAYRSWTIASAAHNTVVIDGLSQAAGSARAPTDGALRLAEFKQPHVQVVSADAALAYPGVAKTYRRTLLLVDAGEARHYAVDLFEVQGGRTHDYFLHGPAEAPARVTAAVPLQQLATLLPAGFKWNPTKNEGEASRAYEPHYAYGFLRSLESGNLPHDAATQVDFHVVDQADASLRVWLFPEPRSQLVLGENPSIRLAREDDAQLDKYDRPFMMVRRQAAGEPSRFVTIIQPLGGQQPVASAKRIDEPPGAVMLEVRWADQTDLIVIGTPQKEIDTGPIAGPSRAYFQGDVGMLRQRGSAVQYAFALGNGGWRWDDFQLDSPGVQRTRLREIESGALVVEGSRIAPPAGGDVVRLLTADGWVYPFNVVGATAHDSGSTIRIDVAEGPRMNWDASGQALQLLAFPQREHSGVVHVEWSPGVSWTAEPTGD